MAANMSPEDHDARGIARSHLRCFPPTRRSVVWSIVPILLFAALTCACVDRNNVHSIPRIHGRVVDAATKKPIAGMTIVRWLIRQEGLGPGGSDVALVGGSRISVTTDHGGRFELPGWRGLLRGIDRLEWGAFKSGFMPGKGWFRRAVDDPRHPGYDGAESDPWVQVRFVKAPGGLEMNLQVSRPTLEGIVFRYFDGDRWVPYTPKAGDTDPWAEYFRRLNNLAQYNLPTSQLLMVDASAFAEKRSLSGAMLVPLAETAERLRPADDPAVREDRLRVLRAISAACETVHAPAECQLLIIRDAVREHGLQSQ